MTGFPYPEVSASLFWTSTFSKCSLPMKKETPICISVISIIHCTDFLTFPSLFLRLLFHIHIQYLLLHHSLFGENYIHIAYNVFITKIDYVAITTALTKQLYNKNWTLLHMFFKDSGHRCRTGVQHHLWSKSLK